MKHLEDNEQYNKELEQEVERLLKQANTIEYQRQQLLTALDNAMIKNGMLQIQVDSLTGRLEIAQEQLEKQRDRYCDRLATLIAVINKTIEGTK